MSSYILCTILSFQGGSIYISGVRSMGTNGTSARVFKRKEKTKINVVRPLSQVAFHLPLSFLSRTSVPQKMPRNVFNITLLSSSPDVVKLRSQFAALIAPTSEREDGRDRTRRKSEWSRCTF